MIKPYKTVLLNGEKCFYVNPDYAKIFEYLGIRSDNETFFRANPFEGLHSDTNEDEPHFQYFENNFESHYRGSFRVKRNKLPLLHGNEVSSEQVEKCFASLEVSVEYILDSISSSNEWAKTNYPEIYLPDLESSIAKYKIELEKTR